MLQEYRLVGSSGNKHRAMLELTIADESHVEAVYMVEGDAHPTVAHGFLIDQKLVLNLRVPDDTSSYQLKGAFDGVTFVGSLVIDGDEWSELILANDYDAPPVLAGAGWRLKVPTTPDSTPVPSFGGTILNPNAPAASHDPWWTRAKKRLASDPTTSQLLNRSWAFWVGMVGAFILLLVAAVILGIERPVPQLMFLAAICGGVFSERLVRHLRDVGGFRLYPIIGATLIIIGIGAVASWEPEARVVGAMMIAGGWFLWRH